MAGGGPAIGVAVRGSGLPADPVGGREWLKGTGILAADDEDKKVPTDSGTSRGARPKKGSERDGNVGNALRSVWQQTVSEDIPSDMLDLLGKLN